MELTLKGEAKEIASFVVALQRRLPRTDGVELAKTAEEIFSQQIAQAESGTLIHSCNL